MKVLATALYRAIMGIAIISFAPIVAFAETLDLPVSASGRLYDVQGDLVFESIFPGSALNVHWRNVNFLSQRWAYRSVVEFDLSALPSDAIIHSATLTITPTQLGTSEGNPDFEFYGYTGDGSLTLADAIEGDTLIETVVISSLSSFNVDYSAYVQSLFNSGDTHIGVNMRSADEGKTFNSFDEQFSSNSAVLTVEYSLPSANNTVPMIPTPWLAALAFILPLLASTVRLKKSRSV